tara:strand:+ start:1375 stop:2217 length:843 start_codon:yes stop_codon:yes gene_type:complete
MCLNNNLILEEFVIKLKQQHYAPSSIKAYKSAVKNFLKAFESHELHLIESKTIHNYILELKCLSDISIAYQRQILVAIDKLYLFNFNKKLNLSSYYPKRKTNLLPKFLNCDEIKALLEGCKNIKHLCILKLMYGCGLRISETINLQLSDIDFEAMKLTIRAINTSNTRTVPVPKSLLISLNEYLLVYGPKTFLFEGQNTPQYSPKSIQNFIKRYAQKNGINKKITPYMLRHSYATHQLQRGMNLRLLQELLGHLNIKTTERYSHITNISTATISNPLDQL